MCLFSRWIFLEFSDVRNGYGQSNMYDIKRLKLGQAVLFMFIATADLLGYDDRPKLAHPVAGGLGETF